MSNWNQGNSKGQNRSWKRQDKPADGFDPATSFAAPKSEIVVLSRIMEDPDLMGEIREMLEPDDFSKPAGVAIYGAMCELWTERIPATFPIMMDRLKDYSEDLLLIAKEGQEILGFGPTFATYHAAIVSDFSERRRYYHTAMSGLGRLVAEPGTKVQDVLQAMPGEILRSGSDNNAEGLDSLAHRVYERLSKERTGELKRRVISTGFYDIDSVLSGGFEPGELEVLAARPGMGKTGFAASLLLKATQFGRAVMFSAEMSREQIMTRMAATATGVGLAKIRTHATSDDEHRLLGEAMAELQQVPMTIDDTARISTAQILQRVQRIQASGPVSLVAVDYLELIRSSSNGKGESPYEKISNTVIELKEAAQMAGVPILLLSQVGRSVEARPDKRPNLTDLRLTGVLEQTADRVLFLYSHDHYVARGMEEADDERSGKMEVSIAKNRSGATGRVNIGFDPETLQFYDLTGDARIYDDANR